MSEYRWLSAEVLETEPASLRFYVEVVPEYSDELNERISNHFDVFDLAETYSVIAGPEIAGHAMQYMSTYEIGGRDEVKDELLRTFRVKKAINKNSWLTATYRALARSEWYCDGGFLNSP